MAASGFDSDGGPSEAGEAAADAAGSNSLAPFDDSVVVSDAETISSDDADDSGALILAGLGGSPRHGSPLGGGRTDAAQRPPDSVKTEEGARPGRASAHRFESSATWVQDGADLVPMSPGSGRGSTHTASPVDGDLDAGSGASAGPGSPLHDAECDYDADGAAFPGAPAQRGGSSVFDRNRAHILQLAHRRAQEDEEARVAERKAHILAERRRREVLGRVEAGREKGSFAAATAAQRARAEEARQQKEALAKRSGPAADDEELTEEERQRREEVRKQGRRQRKMHHIRLLRQLADANRQRSREAETAAQKEKRRREAARRAALGDKEVDPRLYAAPRARPAAQEGHDPFLEARDVEKVLQRKVHGIERRADRRLRRRRGSEPSGLSSASDACGTASNEDDGDDGDDDGDGNGSDVPATGSGIRAVRAARTMRNTAGPVAAAKAGPRDRVDPMPSDPVAEGGATPLRTTVAGARVPKPPLVPLQRRPRSASPARVTPAVTGDGSVGPAAGPEVAGGERGAMGADAPRRAQSAAAGSATSSASGNGSDHSGDDGPGTDPEAERARQRDAFLERQTEHLQQLAARRRAQKEAKEEEQQREQRRLAALRSQADAMRRAHVEKREEQRRAEAAAKKKVKYDPFESARRRKETHGTMTAQSRSDAFARWRKQQGVAPDVPVFMVTGWYPDVKRALRKRGWHCNTDLDSPFWNLKFGLKFIDLDYDRLQPDQIVNHFENNTQLTRKVGLMYNLRRLGNYAAADLDTFFPRCYDLERDEERGDFEVDFKACVAEGAVKRLVLYGEEQGWLPSGSVWAEDLARRGGAPPGDEAPSAAGRAASSSVVDALQAAGKVTVPEGTGIPRVQHGSGLAAGSKVDMRVVRAALAVVSRRARGLSNVLEDPRANTRPLVSPQEWHDLDTYTLSGVVRKRTKRFSGRRHRPVFPLPSRRSRKRKQRKGQSAGRSKATPADAKPAATRSNPSGRGGRSKRAAAVKASAAAQKSAGRSGDAPARQRQSLAGPQPEAHARVARPAGGPDAASQAQPRTPGARSSGAPAESKEDWKARDMLASAGPRSEDDDGLDVGAWGAGVEGNPLDLELDLEPGGRHGVGGSSGPETLDDGGMDIAQFAREWAEPVAAAPQSLFVQGTGSSGVARAGPSRARVEGPSSPVARRSAVEEKKGASDDGASSEESEDEEDESESSEENSDEDEDDDDEDDDDEDNEDEDESDEDGGENEGAAGTGGEEKAASKPRARRSAAAPVKRDGGRRRDAGSGEQKAGEEDVEEEGSVSVDAELEPITRRMCEEALAELRALAERPAVQYHLNGAPGQNIWILKPAGKSRGRGIRCLNDLEQIREYTTGEETQWVAQKYIENPLLVYKRKFDIRQWVLVTSWNPLVVWMYRDSYMRFCVEEFDVSRLHDQFVHLSNNSIQKKSAKFNDTDIEGNMISSGHFQELLLRAEGSSERWTDVILPQMKQVVRWSLMAAQEQVGDRENSFELFGYDFMIDELDNVQLIEINSSPDFSYSTKVTKDLVKAVSDDIFKVVLDWKQWRWGEERRRRGRMRRRARKRKAAKAARRGGETADVAAGAAVSDDGGAAAEERAEDGAAGTQSAGESAEPVDQYAKQPPPDTGGWELILEEPLVSRPLASFSGDFACDGRALKKSFWKRPKGVPEPAQ